MVSGMVATIGPDGAACSPLKMVAGFLRAVSSLAGTLVLAVVLLSGIVVGVDLFCEKKNQELAASSTITSTFQRIHLLLLFFVFGVALSSTALLVSGCS